MTSRQSSLSAIAMRGYEGVALPAYHRYRDLVSCNPARTWWQRRRLLAEPGLGEDERRLLRSVSSRIAGRDAMYKGDGAHYFSVGLSAIRCIDAALDAAGLREVASVLDLPCGNGRVCRFLGARFPAARLSACDLERPAVDFCARRFGARGVYSRVDLEHLAAGDEFDLIWCGSLITHLPAQSIAALLGFFQRCLRPGGVAVWSAHGDLVVENLTREGSSHYGLGEARAQALVAAYRESGYGFADYPKPRPGYGFSLTSRAWMQAAIRALPGWSEVWFAARGWDDHHDVYAVRKDG